MTIRRPTIRSLADPEARALVMRANARKDETPATPKAPRIRELRPQECLALIKRHAVGRMAFSFHDRVDITPIHYAYCDGWLFARTSHGAKMTTIRHAPWVGFEVDEVGGVFDWRSVVVHGTVYVMERDGGATEVALWSKGIATLRRIIPETGADNDPVPFRTLVFGIHIDSMTGRCSVSGLGKQRVLRKRTSAARV